MRRLRLSNPDNRWEHHSLEYDPGESPSVGLQVFEEQSRGIVSSNQSPDLPFEHSLNPYRGCAHGCAYCYARPSHEYLGYGAGTDFERKLVTKPSAALLLRKTFNSSKWQGALLVLSGNTDPYQPLEAQYGLTRQCLEVCREYSNPVHVITKGALVERDISLLLELNRRASATVSISIAFWNEEASRVMEPYAPTPMRRLKTIERLSEAGLAVMVSVAPVIPGLSDRDVIPILTAARNAGARSATMAPIRLPGSTAQVFEERLRHAFPLRAERILARIRESRGGNLNDSRFTQRFRGEGPYSEALRSLFRATCKRLAYTALPPANCQNFCRPAASTAQLSLF